MVDMTQFSKKQTAGQKIRRLEWILDTVRANQEEVGLLLHALARAASAPTTSIALNAFDMAQFAIADMHKQDRDAILQPNGILTDQQIEVLK